MRKYRHSVNLLPNTNNYKNIGSASSHPIERIKDLLRDTNNGLAPSKGDIWFKIIKK